MALKPCKECGKEISSKAKSCPHCGAEVESARGCLPAFIIGAIVIGSIMSLNSNTPSRTPKLESLVQQTTPISNLPSPSLNTWEYSVPIDDVSGKVSYYAMLKSNNIVDLDFPYQGGTQATLAIRKHPRDGLNVLVIVNKGQLNCQYDNCYIPIRYDDGPVIKNYVTESAENSNLAFFLSKPKANIGKIAKSKKMYIELTFFSQGAHTFEFNTEDLDAKNLR